MLRARVCRSASVALLALATAAVLAAAPAAHADAPQQVPAAPAAAPAHHTVTYDGYSFLIDGQRTYLWSGEFHYYRLPSPDLWRDVLQKMKAAGFNAASRLYFDWAYHSPQPGVYDFTGVRDVDKLLDMADEVGHLRDRPARPVHQRRGRLRRLSGLAGPPSPAGTAAPIRTTWPHADEWLTQIDAILARHQFTERHRHRDHLPGGERVLRRLRRRPRLHGAPGGQGPRRRHHRAADRQPQRHVQHRRRRARRRQPGLVPAGLQLLQPDRVERRRRTSPTTTRRASRCTRRVPGRRVRPVGRLRATTSAASSPAPDFESVFYKQNIAVGATQQSFYMTYGGTSWGWQPDPTQVYTSYDYGAPITEARQLTAKYDEDKRIGYFTAAVAPLTKTDRARRRAPTDLGRDRGHRPDQPRRRTPSSTCCGTATPRRRRPTRTHIALDLNAARPATRTTMPTAR